VECGICEVECGICEVECGIWEVECGIWEVEEDAIVRGCRRIERMKVI
jgi:hypothetical protein